LDEVKDNDYSLTPGRYVGVTFVEDDGVDYKESLARIQLELLDLNNEAVKLSELISTNLINLI
jgi:type I restriction enzyme M protein